MARKRNTAIATRTRVIRTPPPKVQIVRVGNTGRKVKRAVARGASRAAIAARDEKHTLAAVVGAAAVGMAKKHDVDLPHIDALGTAGTYGAAALIAAKFTKSKTLAHVATGMLSVAAYQLAAGETLSGEDDW